MIDWSKPKKERACPLCGTETEVKDKSVSSTARSSFRVCPNPDCLWSIPKGGRWTSPRRQEDYPVGSIGWESFDEAEA